MLCREATAARGCCPAAAGSSWQATTSLQSMTMSGTLPRWCRMRRRSSKGTLACSTWPKRAGITSPGAQQQARRASWIPYLALGLPGGNSSSCLSVTSRFLGVSDMPLRLRGSFRSLDSKYLVFKFKIKPDILKCTFWTYKEKNYSKVISALVFRLILKKLQNR